MDLSPLRKFEVTGPDAEILLQRTVTRDMRKLAVGQVVYTALCYDHGGMIDDATVFRLSPTNFRMVCGRSSPAPGCAPRRRNGASTYMSAHRRTSSTISPCRGRCPGRSWRT